MVTVRIGSIGPRGAAIAVLVFALSGCGTKPEYPANYAFPSRTDRLVIKPPESSPPGPGEPGQIDKELSRLDAAGGRTLDPTGAAPETRSAVDQFLKDTFGTPAEPRIAHSDDAAVAGATERLSLTADRLAEGGKLFRRNCDRCHNVTGDARGSAGLWLTPYPRDFRRGSFKFTSTAAGGKPRRVDILQTLVSGLKGTAMPSFSLLSENERELLAGYVTYLALRGQVEYETFTAVLTGATSDVAGHARGRLKAGLAEWESAQSSPAFSSPPNDGEPGATAHAAAVQRGYEIFTRKADNSCITCHGDFGRKPLLRYDIWGTVARPADLTATSLKGGTRPEDVFARIRGGIPAVGMPAHAELTDRQVWDLVRFVKSAPYQRELPSDVLKAVYPDAGGVP